MGGTGEFVEPSTGLTRCVPRGNVQFRSNESSIIFIIYIHSLHQVREKFYLAVIATRHERLKAKRDLNRFLDSSWDCCAVYPKLGKSFSLSLSFSIPLYIFLSLSRYIQLFAVILTAFAPSSLPWIICKVEGKKGPVQVSCGMWHVARVLASCNCSELIYQLLPLQCQHDKEVRGIKRL